MLNWYEQAIYWFHFTAMTCYNTWHPTVECFQQIIVFTVLSLRIRRIQLTLIFLENILYHV